MAETGTAEDRVFTIESVASVWDEALPLMRANHAETGCLPDHLFDPDLDRYLALEESGALRLFCMREPGEPFGRLLGYALFLVTKPLHYKDSAWAMQDVLYVDPTVRGPKARDFVRWQDEQLAREHVNVIYRHSSERRDCGSLLAALGYAPVERAWLRRTD